jgi:hypothetical protein
MADIAKTNAVKNGNIQFSPAAGAASQTIVVSKDERMCVYVNNGGGAPITATIPKGNGIASAAGDLAVTVTNGTSQIIGPLESARFVDVTTGKMTLNLSGTTSVTVGVIQL